MAKKIRKKDKNVLKWMFTVCKKQVPLMILLVVLNAIYGVSSVFFAKFSKKAGNDKNSTAADNKYKCKNLINDN